MQYQVFVQNQLGARYVATIIGFPNCVAEGLTKEQAVAKVQAALAERLAGGELVTIEVETPGQAAGNPWLESAGVFKDDPAYDEFLENIAAYRRELDAEATASEVSQTATQ